MREMMDMPWDFGGLAYVNPERVHIKQLSDDIYAIKSQPARELALEGTTVIRSLERNRTIEEFQMRYEFRHVCKVTFSDCKVSQSSYSTCRTSREIEKTITEEIGEQPSLATVQRVAAHVILAQAGQLGGRSQDYWIKARDLAQQQLHINPDIEEIIRQQMDQGIGNDPAFVAMLAIVKECIKDYSFNPYFQSKRDKHAVARDLFTYLGEKDIKGEVIFCQLSGAFSQFVWDTLEHEASQAIEAYSTLHAVPLPDMTRHGLHYIEWLVDHPELDFRNPQHDPRTAKSGLYYFGVRASPNDPNGMQNPKQTRDIRRAIPYMVGEGHRLKQLEKLRKGPFRLCTEMLRHVFKILDPSLLSDYDSVAKEVAKLPYLDETKTLEHDDPFVLRSLLINLMTYEQRNTSDWHCGLTGQVVMGDFDGGDLLLRELGLRIEGKRQSLQLYRGRELRYATTEWTGRRFVLVSTVHEAVKRWAFRSMGRSVPPDIPPFDDCLDIDQEDVVPENRPRGTRRRRLAHRSAMKTTRS
ncbi:hypothetical protein SLS62_001221 [Diatrype stigma]|uniref:Uncharacterized protein n=1 Tax=Diatrype stigma TaxID=117547 RepID=A0AAN9UYP1_9PEZI